jgi:SPP1 gp7 family putative phage head morphogenesis protein
MSKQKKENRPVIQQIVIRPPVRRTNDVSRWRNALRAADMGRIANLYNLYEDLLIDGLLSDAQGKRIDAVNNSLLTFQDANKYEVPEIINIIDSPAWEKLITTIMQVKFWGRAGGEFDFTEGFNFTPIPPKHISLETQSILIREYDMQGIPYADDDHILALGKPRDFGLFLKTAPYTIYKRGGFGDYAEWLEIFGMPQRIGKYSSHDPQSRQLLEDALKTAGSAPWAVVPKETEVETVNNTGTSGSNTAHNDFRKACNEEILITILGQTMTTLDGSSRSQSEVHKAVEEGKNRADLRYVRKVLNHYVLPILENRGYPVKDGKFVYPEASEPLTVSDIVSLTKIIDIPVDYLRDKYSIPAAEEGDAIAGKQKPKEEETGKEDPDKMKEEEEGIENSDRNLLRRMWDFFVSAPAQTGAHGRALTLNDADFYDRLIKRAIDVADFDPELFYWISNDLLKALTAKPVRLADFGFTYNYQNDARTTAMEMNVFHFSAAKSIAEIQMLNELYRKSKSFEEFYKLASDKLEVFNKEWQRTEWQTATLIANSTENYNRLKSKTQLFPYWQYKTVGDDKVRDSHRKLHDIILPANDPRWNKIWPPNGWKCRCYVIAKMANEVEGYDFDAARVVVDKYLASDEWAKDAAQGFGTNRAQSWEVFKENQLYIKKFPRMAKKLLKNVNYNTYGLKSYEQMRSQLGGTLQRWGGTIEEYAKTLKVEDGKSFFTDYNGRSIQFDADDWLKMHAGKKATQRAPYMKAVAETLQQPDEVWITPDTLNQYVFLKYYKDEALAVIGEVKAGTVYKVKTFFPVREKVKAASKEKWKELVTKYRRGLLIKKPG